MGYYFDKQGRQISKEQWRQLQADLRYTTIREFENDRIYARVHWYGEVLTSAVPPEHRKLFKITVQNIVTHDSVTGERLAVPRRSHDPDASDSFRTEKEAIAVYEDLLVRYADCEWAPAADGGSHFIDTGNKLTPPPPPPPDAPQADEAPAAVATLIGSW